MLGLGWAEITAFAGLCLLLAATPGGNLLVVLRSRREGGRRGTVGATLGLTTGKVVWAAASVLGLAALLATSPIAYEVLRLAGAAYLVVLGAQALRSLHRSRRTAAGTDPATPSGLLAGFRRGLTGDLLNPKVGIFYTTVFPQFIGPEDAVAPAAAVLLVTHAAVLLAWYPAVSAVLDRAGSGRPRLTRFLDGATGCALIALGVRLAASPL